MTEMDGMKKYAVAIGVLAIVVLMSLAVVIGFKNTNLVDNATADNFVTGLKYFGIFAGVLAIAGIGLMVIRMFSGGSKKSL